MSMNPTLEDHLTATRTAVSAEEYEASKLLHPAQGASWALWGEATGDLSVFDAAAKVVPRLRKDVVLIGANFGIGKDDGPFTTFQNFHASTSGGDTKLRRGVTGTALEGAFLTDIVKDYPTKYADGLASQIRNNELDIERHVAAGFRAEQEALGLGLDTLYIPIGGRTRALWDQLVDLGVIPAAQRVFHREYGGGPLFKGMPVQNLTHYSAAVNMVQAVEVVLGQPALK